MNNGLADVKLVSLGTRCKLLWCIARVSVGVQWPMSALVSGGGNVRGVWVSQFVTRTTVSLFRRCCGRQADALYNAVQYSEAQALVPAA